jgi:hypothetical protein
MATANVVGITVAIVSVVVIFVVLSYCLVKRRLICRVSGPLRRNGGRAADYFDHCDCGAQPPPPYEFTMPFPPPYSPTKSADKPPAYDLVLLSGTGVTHQAVTLASAPDSAYTEICSQEELSSIHAESSL